MKILIADDEKEIGALFETLLKSRLADSKIDVVVNGAEAVDAFRTANHDFLLMDVRMPVKDGYQACLEIQELCRKEKLKMPRIIFYTGYGVSEEIEALLADKTHFALLKKPVIAEDVINTFKTMMRE